MTIRKPHPHLKLVQQSDKPFRRPRKAAAPKGPPPLTRDGKEVEDIIRNAERVAEIVARLYRAINEGDQIVVREVGCRANVEARFTAELARRLREGAQCA